MAEPDRSLTVVQSEGAKNIGGYPLLPDGVIVEAQCVKLETVTYTFGRDIRTRKVKPQRKKVLTFRVIHPVELSFFEGDEKRRPVELQMYVREEEHWKRPPVRSKLLKVLMVLQGGKLSPYICRISRELVLHQIFLCKVTTVKPKDSPLDGYSEVEMILKKAITSS